jgi:hypothetical protein
LRRDADGAHEEDEVEHVRIKVHRDEPFSQIFNFVSKGVWSSIMQQMEKLSLWNQNYTADMAFGDSVLYGYLQYLQRMSQARAE